MGLGEDAAGLDRARVALDRQLAVDDQPAVTFGDLEKVGIELDAIVDRREYGLNWNAPLPKGGFALGNDVTLSASLELARA